MYAGLDGSARGPSASLGGDVDWTKGEVEDEVQREASAGDGRRAVAVLLQKMLSATRFVVVDDVVVVVASGSYGDGDDDEELLQSTAVQSGGTQFVFCPESWSPNFLFRSCGLPPSLALTPPPLADVCRAESLFALLLC